MGPRTLWRFSLDSGLEERSSSSRARLVRCGGSEGPTDGILSNCLTFGVGCRCLEELVGVRLLELGPTT
jgi:hypothetical protein